MTRTRRPRRRRRVVAGLLRREGQLLLCHRHPARTYHPDVWDLPGRHVEAGESMTGALVRELREELGIVIALPQKCPWETIRVDEAELNVYIVDQWQGEPDNNASHEHDEIRWVTPSDIGRLQLAHDSYRSLLRRSGESI